MEVRARAGRLQGRGASVSEQTIPKLNSAAFIRSLIADMRKTKASPDLVLDMDSFTEKPTARSKCHVCAGGSAVIHAMGGPASEILWTRDQWAVARWCNYVRSGYFEECEDRRYPVPEEVQEAWSDDMRQVGPKFFGAWERFATAWEAYEAKVSA